MQQSDEKKLGMEVPITRRDFIGSTLVGASGALMATPGGLGTVA